MHVVSIFELSGASTQVTRGENLFLDTNYCMGYDSLRNDTKIDGFFFPLDLTFKIHVHVNRKLNYAFLFPFVLYYIAGKGSSHL